MTQVDGTTAQPIEGRVSSAVSPVDHLVDLAAASEELDWLRVQADEHEAHSRSENTRRAYTADWAQFEAWCARYGLGALPASPDTVRLYATDLALQVTGTGDPRFKVSTIKRHLAAISRHHYDTGHGSGLARHPAVSNVVRGLARARQESAQGRRPLLLDDVRGLVTDMEHATWPAGVQSARDTFAILLGFAAALRRSEAAALTAGQIVRVPLDGLHVRLGATKTDQEGQGVVLAVPFGSTPQTCVPCAWVRWTRLLGAWDTHGRAAALKCVLGTPEPDRWRHVCRGTLPSLDPAAPLFRRISKSGAVGDRAVTGSALNEVVKRRLAASGYDPAPYGFHSLRAGFVTQARRNGADARSVRRQTRHGSDAMIDVYDREHLPMEGNAVRHLGL